MMKTRLEIERMIDRVSGDDSIEEERGPLVMALEWVLGESVSTSLGLEDWLDEAHAASKEVTE